MIYQNILAAFDGSENAEEALKQAVRLAEKSPGSKLTVVYSKYRPPVNFPYYPLPGMAEIEERIQEYDQSIMQKAREMVKDIPNAEVMLQSSSPALSILECAEEIGADLIVIGSRGLGTFKEMMLGSVSHYVAQHAKVPVLIVKH